MGLSDILETIRAESEKTASGLIEEAETEAKDVLVRARADADSEEERLAGSLDERIRLERARVLSRSHLDAAQVRRAAREEVYKRAVEAVADRLAVERSSDGYEDLLASLLDEAMTTMPGATAVRVDPSDVTVMKRVLDARGLDIAIETEETPSGGLVLTAPGRKVDNTLSTRLSRADSHLRFVAGEIIPELRRGGSE